MIDLKEFQVWFLTGSQHLYGEETIKQVAGHAKEIADYLNDSEDISVSVVFKPVLTTSESIFDTLVEASSDKKCIGVVTWMHTFSPAKMWIRGLKALQKPLLHLHTQYNSEIPWDSIDMDFMNLNQSAHGDREFGHIVSKLGKQRKVVTGYWQDEDVLKSVDSWARACAAWQDWQGAKFARFGDNMREVSVTDGDKVAAEERFGFSVNTYAVGDLVKVIDAVSDAEVQELIKEYESTYILAENVQESGSKRQNLIDAAQIELGMKKFLEQGGFKGFSNTFEDLYGMKQLPGIATQRLMEQGYGYAGEGDWKTAALVRAAKVMGAGLKGGNSFMEDYTYHLKKGEEMVLGAHMLEVDPSLTSEKPRLEVHPLSIGGKDDPARLVFDGDPAEKALNASLVDMGGRFRLVMNDVVGINPNKDMPKLPVARVFWKPLPSLQVAASGWIYAAGAHHTVYSQNLSLEHFSDFAAFANIEVVHIGKDTDLYQLQKELLWNDKYYTEK